MSSRVHLIHWRDAEVPARVERLRAAGFRVTHGWPAGAAALRALRESPPDAFVIDLSRLPMQGRDVGLILRKYRRTRAVPLIFVAGGAEKVARVRKVLPDAAFTAWGQIRAVLRLAIASPPPHPVVPDSVFAGYAGTPLPRKLGIKPGATVALVGAPPNFEQTLGELPESVVLRRNLRGRPDLVIWFLTRRKELEARIAGMRDRTPKGGMWILWPKKASATDSDLSQAVVRNLGLAAGLVDYKVAAIDETWSGLKFARRLT